MPRNQYRIGIVLADLGRSEEGLPHLQKAATLDPFNGDALFYLGKVYLDLDRFSDAEKVLNKALECQLTPKQRTAVHYQLWMVYQKLGKPEEAAKQMETYKKLEAEQAAARKDLR